MVIFDGSMRAFPNPKLNLGLSVLRKRPDGYHDLETLFVPWFGVRDVLDIEPAGEFSISIVPGSDSPYGSVSVDWDPMGDLTARAWQMLHASFGIPPVAIRLQKNIPVGAGLGGGSADAAFALVLMNELFGLGLGSDALAGHAARLGSDCAFFIYNRPMLGTGRGEVLQPFDICLDGYDVRVEIPEGEHVSTREAYGGIVPREARPCALPSLGEALSAGIEHWNGVLVNDFEQTVFALHPKIAALKQSMYERGAVYAAMSGSGSSVFGIFRSE